MFSEITIVRGVRAVLSRGGAVLCGSISVCGGVADASLAEPLVKVSGPVVRVRRALLGVSGTLG